MNLGEGLILICEMANIGISEKWNWYVFWLESNTGR